MKSFLFWFAGALLIAMLVWVGVSVRKPTTEHPDPDHEWNLREMSNLTASIRATTAAINRGSTNIFRISTVAYGLHIQNAVGDSLGLTFSNRNGPQYPFDWRPTNMVVIAGYEPVVTQSTNGEWHITFNPKPTNDINK